MASRPLTVPGQLRFDGLDDPQESLLEAKPAELVDPLDVDVDVDVDAGPGEDQGGGAGSSAPLEVEVIRSARRTKSAQARLIGNTIQVRIPARCSASEERELVNHFATKFARARSTDRIDLEERAARLAEEYGLPEPNSIRWVTNQRYRWGSCTPSDLTIRISERLAEFPAWVLDYVIVHELAHLVVAGHNAEFWELVNAYPRTERARGFLFAKGLDED